MRFSALTTACAVCAVTSLAVAGHAQTIHLIQPVDGAIVRETVPFRVPAGDMPAGGYAVVKIDGAFRTARVLPESASAPVYLWDTKAGGTEAVPDGPHTVELDIYDKNSNLVGTASAKLQVANQISPPSQDLKLVYHWTSQHRLVYHRTSAMTVPGSQAASGAASTGTAPPDQTLQSSDLEFVRTTEDAAAAQCLVRDIIARGTVTDHGQQQTITTLYTIAPYRRTVNARGEIMSAEETADFADHIGFPIPELPVRRVGKGDSWQANVQIPLTWDASSAAHVTAECRLEDFEWQNGYPCAKIVETYGGPANFVARAATASNRMAPKLNASAVTFNRTIYFSYNSCRLIKTVTHTEVTVSVPELNSLGGSVPAATGGGFPGGFPGGRPPFRMQAPQFGGSPNFPQPDAAPVNAILAADETTSLEAP